MHQKYNRLAWVGVVAALAWSPAAATAGDIGWPSGDDADPAGSVVWSRSDDGAAWAQWDVFAAPYNVVNSPDEGSSKVETTGTSTVNQTGTDTAFIIGPGVSGNIYSFAEATSFEVILEGFGDDTPDPGESNILVISSWTEGNVWDYGNALLSYEDDGSTETAPLLGRYSVFDQPAGGAFGGVSEQYQWIYDITGITGPLTWTASSASSSMSLQQFAADSIAIDAALVPVPEPASAVFALGGLTLILTARRRIKR